MMAIRSHSSRRKPSIHDANSIVSKTWTDRVSDYVMKLPDSPEATYLKTQFKSKFVSDDTDPASTRRQRAINKWLATERDNEATNDRVITTLGDYNILPRVTWSSFVAVTQRFVRDIIGEVPPEEALIGAFSGGASTSRTRTESNPASKYLGQADTTSAARSWFEISLELMPGWGSFSDNLILNEVKGNVLFTVPKKTDIDRCAAKEPDINMFLQKGVGNFFRSALRKRGINLNDQSRNQYLARVGSLTGDLATLDLSSASDSVSTNLVELLLPTLWFGLLADLRSPITIIDGEEHVNEMFSSMGNGFTFELESLLFYCLARASAYCLGISGVISVYGDDIICPRELAQPLMTVLEYCGFQVNTSKSFYDGPFRESCGGHFYNGYDITPFYLRKPITRLTDLIHIGNQIRRWCDRGSCSVLNPLLEPLWLEIRDSIPRCLWGGREYGSITQLVSPNLPNKRLVPRQGSDVLGDGSYIHWLNTTWARVTPGEAVETSVLSIVGSSYRLRPSQPRKLGWCSIPLATKFFTEFS